MRFLGLSLGDRAPDAKTIWLFREQLVRAGAMEKLFERFELSGLRLPTTAARSLKGSILSFSAKKVADPVLTFRDAALRVHEEHKKAAWKNGKSRTPIQHRTVCSTRSRLAVAPAQAGAAAGPGDRLADSGPGLCRGDVGFPRRSA